MGKELTERQQEILEFIRNYVEMNSYPPTYREIGNHFGISSTFGVKRHIDALVKKGVLNIGSNANRSMSVVYNEEAAADISEQNNFEIPIIGRVAAGYPILAEENIEGKMIIDPSLAVKRKDLFALKVRGDSMIEAGILEDDLVIVHQQKEANNGDIVVALIDKEATMKKFQKQADKVLLIPENKNYNIIEVNETNDFQLIGKVVGVFRTYN